MEVVKSGRAIRILSLEPQAMEDALAAIGDEYAVTHWNFATVNNAVVITCVLISARIVRQMQLANASMPRAAGQ